jgi:hypothetical protein
MHIKQRHVCCPKGTECEGDFPLFPHESSSRVIKPTTNESNTGSLWLAGEGVRGPNSEQRCSVLPSPLRSAGDHFPSYRWNRKKSEDQGRHNTAYPEDTEAYAAIPQAAVPSHCAADPHRVGAPRRGAVPCCTMLRHRVAPRYCTAVRCRGAAVQRRCAVSVSGVRSYRGVTAPP